MKKNKQCCLKTKEGREKIGSKGGRGGRKKETRAGGREGGDERDRQMEGRTEGGQALIRNTKSRCKSDEKVKQIFRHLKECTLL